VPVRDRRPGDEQPLVRSVQGQQLFSPPGGEQESAPSAGGEQEETSVAGEARAEQSSQGGKGPVSQAMDRAQENNWVYGSVAEKARETGLLDKADEVLSKVRSALAGG
jgi:hypothetical protein